MSLSKRLYEAVYFTGDAGDFPPPPTEPDEPAIEYRPSVMTREEFANAGVVRAHPPASIEDAEEFWEEFEHVG